MMQTRSQPDHADPIPPLMRCPACGAGDLTTIDRVESIPVHSCILMKTQDEARAYPTRDLQLDFCDACGAVFNSILDAAAQEYSTNFEESQHFSETFNRFAKGLARDLADRHDLKGKRVLEIGCGKGEFLTLMCRTAGCTGVGIDPGYRPDRAPPEAEGLVTFIQDFYGPAHADLEADVIVCRHTLEHIAQTKDFVTDIRRTIGDRTDTLVFFETPDVYRVLTEGAFWDVYYEHCSYFTAGTHARLFRRCGFDVTELSLQYDNQYIIQMARPADGPTEARLPLENDLDAVRRAAADYPAIVAERREHWRRLVQDAASEGRRVVLWGGGSKAVSFLTTLGLDSAVDFVVDVNPHKQGTFLPVSAHAVAGPKRLMRDRPDLVIAMNPIYLNEIRRDLDDMNLTPELLAV